MRRVWENNVSWFKNEYSEFCYFYIFLPVHLFDKHSSSWITMTWGSRWPEAHFRASDLKIKSLRYSDQDRRASDLEIEGLRYSDQDRRSYDLEIEGLRYFNPDRRASDLEMVRVWASQTINRRFKGLYKQYV